MVIGMMTGVLIDSYVGASQPWPSSTGTFGKVLGLGNHLPKGGTVRALRIIPIVPVDEGQGREASMQETIRTTAA